MLRYISQVLLPVGRKSPLFAKLLEAHMKESCRHFLDENSQSPRITKTAPLLSLKLCEMYLFVGLEDRRDMSVEFQRAMRCCIVEDMTRCLLPSCAPCALLALC
jgi:hypothetical protein